MDFRAILLVLPCVALALAVPDAARGGRISVYPGQPGEELDSPVVFETVLPIRDLQRDAWTPSQRKEIASLAEKMRRDERIFLVVKAVVDPIGSREENEKWALGISREVAQRLKESGIRADRILIVPGEEDRTLFDGPRWEGFVPLQKVTIQGYLGGEWLRRRSPPAPATRGIPGGNGLADPLTGETGKGRDAR